MAAVGSALGPSSLARTSSTLPTTARYRLAKLICATPATWGCGTILTHAVRLTKHGDLPPAIVNCRNGAPSNCPTSRISRRAAIERPPAASTTRSLAFAGCAGSGIAAQIRVFYRDLAVRRPQRHRNDCHRVLPRLGLAPELRGAIRLSLPAMNRFRTILHGSRSGPPCQVSQKTHNHPPSVLVRPVIRPRRFAFPVETAFQASTAANKWLSYREVCRWQPG